MIFFPVVIHEICRFDLKLKAPLPSTTLFSSPLVVAAMNFVFACLPVCLPACLSVCLSVCLAVWLSSCLFVCSFIVHSFVCLFFDVV